MFPTVGRIVHLHKRTPLGLVVLALIVAGTSASSGDGFMTVSGCYLDVDGAPHPVQNVPFAVTDEIAARWRVDSNFLDFACWPPGVNGSSGEAAGSGDGADRSDSDG